MTKLEQAEKELKEIKEKHDKINNELYKHFRERAKVIEDIEQELESNCDIDKLTKLKTRKSALDDIINKLKEKASRYEKYEITRAEETLNNTKAKAAYFEREINQNLIYIELKKKDIEDLQQEINKLENIIKSKEKENENFKENYKATTNKELELLKGKELNKKVVQAINQKLYG